MDLRHDRTQNQVVYTRSQLSFSSVQLALFFSQGASARFAGGFLCPLHFSFFLFPPFRRVLCVWGGLVGPVSQLFHRGEAGFKRLGRNTEPKRHLN